MAEDVQSSQASLLQGLLHQCGGNSANLNIHLERRDPVLRPTDLEVHIAQMIFQAENVRQE